MGLSGLEPPTSRLSGVRSNRLSYKPAQDVHLISFGERSKNLNSAAPRTSSLTFLYSGSHLLFHTVSSIVPSAAWVLTIVFGMGTGVTPRRIATGSFELLMRRDHRELRI